ncbi:sel1 repeat family protein [Nordella sp. HKS 07]|uniref:SEL1-like repeat protein n=1 Tax=Nordella sp. HKS 07 TaxID=2712222 RepID=UPI0013E189DC|nr:sel1 repeat family protein [Nordella sp. HKS 07]QIG50995.1 sel1 repeat family protein [Nordella sp. HKS 07]
MIRSATLPRPAVEKGTSAEMLFHLGMMYRLGREVERNYVTAHKWFNIAALKGSHEARRCRCEISREMTAPEIAEAQRQARDWISLH